METISGTNSLNRLIRHLDVMLEQGPLNSPLLREQRCALDAVRHFSQLLKTQRASDGAQITVVVPEGQIQRTERVLVHIGKPLTKKRQVYRVTLSTKPCCRVIKVELVGYGQQRVGISFRVNKDKATHAVRLRPTISTRIKLRILRLSSFTPNKESDHHYIRSRLQNCQLLHW